MTTSTTYYVIPDQYSSLHYASENTFTLQHYLNNTSEYFVSYNQLHFLPGQYYINSNLVFRDINTFTLTGHGINQSIIICSSPASIVVTFVSNFTLQNIAFIDCISNSSKPASNLYISVYFYYCVQIAIHQLYVNVSSSAPAGIAEIYLLNVFSSTLINVKVQVNIVTCYQYPYAIKGISVYYSGRNKINAWSPYVMIEAFNYYAQKSCEQYIQCGITLLPVHTPLFRAFILNTVFSNLSDSSLLCYHGSINRKYDNATIVYISITNVTVMLNTAAEVNYLKLFLIELDIFESFSKSSSIKFESIIFYNMLMIKFHNCSFIRNSKIDAMIHIKPSTISETVAYVMIENSTFSNNKDVHFLKIERPKGIVPSTTTYVFLTNLIISNNDHHNFSGDLILVTNGHVRFANNIFIANYYKYKSLITLHSSMLYFQLNNIFINNKARYIIKAQKGTIFFMFKNATVNLIDNIAYKVVQQVNIPDNSGVPICPIQFYDTEHNVQSNDLDSIKCKILLLNNTEMISKSLPSELFPFINTKCEWFEDTTFKWTNAKTVYNKVIKLSNTVIDKSSERVVPLSICPCLQNGSYNCYDVTLGFIFPGQTLHIQLIIPPQWSTSSSTIIVANTKDDDCGIVDSYQLSQSHPISHGCNSYSYTIWPNSRHTTECKLFIGLSEMPEMFYVQIKPCPVGFTLQGDKNSCYCDPLLLNSDILSITSCNLDDETILRPANSWISADTNNNSHTYKVSPQCPFDYCLQHSSNLNLTNPDSQCQFKRSGVLCGECQQSLSAVFGSSQCKECSNLYLFIIIPIAIAGIVLVIILFTFNLTVTNGIINTLIFYVNIISINHSQFCFYNNSPDCTLLSLLNLDLGIETCFYDGMDGYAKMWLQLAFPSYLMLIAFALIIGSRYSSNLQRLTANRVLKVLATLFLLCYTKVLLTVCQVLFFFLSVTHIPSKHTTTVWSISTSVVPFGVKFCILYIVCLILFIILLIFNIVLLFPRTASRWKFISYFKPLLDAYFGPYKLRFQFWTGLQLLIRSCFFGLSALSRNVSLYSGTIIVGIVLYVHGILHPFKSKCKNNQESFILLDLLGLYVTALYSYNENNTNIMLIARLLIITVLIYFIGLIFCHCVMLKCGEIIKHQAIKVKGIFIKMIRTKQVNPGKLNMGELRSKIPDVAFNYKEFQEPLVALD